MKIEKLKKIKKGQNIFTSTGVSRVKVTKEGESICYEIPITSTGITEIMEKFQRNAPQPPIVNTLVKPEDEIGKENGITKNTWMKIPNLGDKNYLEEKQKYQSDLGIAILMQGMILEIMDENDEVIVDDDKKLEVLKEQGLSANHFTQIIDDITNLTKWNNGELEGFLEEKSG